MRFPFEALGESWEAQLRAETVVPPIRTVQDFLQRDQYVLLRQLKCTFEDLLALKRQVLTLQFPVVEQNQPESGLLSVFSKVLTSNGNNEVQSSTITSSNTHSIFSGLAGLDNLFACNVTPGGGIPRSQVCCLAGESGSGRSQIAMHTAINAAMQGHCVLYIDTHNAVSARRLHSFLSFQLVEEQITMSTTLTQEEQSDRMTTALDRIHIRRCYDLFQALTLLTQLTDQQQEHHNLPLGSNPASQTPYYDLIIIDSAYHWLAPYMSDPIERYPTLTTTMHSATQQHASTSSGPTSAAGLTANIHPLIVQLGILLRQLASARRSSSSNALFSSLQDMPTQPHRAPHPQSNQPTTSNSSSAAVLVTMLPSHLHYSTTTGGSIQRHESTSGNATNSSRALAMCWQDIFDSVLHLTNISRTAGSTGDRPIRAAQSVVAATALGETTIAVQVVHRPPYFKAQPESGLVGFPW